MNYNQFLDDKRIIFQPSGVVVDNVSQVLFPFQQDLTKWALRKGKAALFTMTGTGKTLMQCEWASHIPGDVLIVAPLAVSYQTVKEAQKLGITITPCRSQTDVRPGINITNYENLHKFDASKFAGVVLDESSILKAYDGKTRTAIIEMFRNTPYKLPCTATPAPNDFMELGNHAEFLGVMSRTEMLSMFFVHDGSDTSKWRLKGHAEDKFWEWVASWAVVLSKPSELGYSDEGFELPPLNIEESVVKSEGVPDNRLFVVEAKTLQDRQRARTASIEERVRRCAEIVNSTREPFLVWCDLNRESELLAKLIPDAVEVSGSDSNEHKERSMLEFSEGQIRVLVTKPSIAGFGMNWQHCADMAFVGLSDSFEKWFQAVRRCWRFGQTRPVNVHVITSEAEGAVVQNIKRKEADAMRMIEAMVQHTKEITKKNIGCTQREETHYRPGQQMILPHWLRGENVAS